MNNSTLPLIFIITLLCYTGCKGQQSNTPKKQSDNYTYKSGDRNGIGKWHMGREIAQVMGFQGINWLERSDRDREENTAALLKNMNIQPTDVIADVGAGSGYHVFKIAPQLTTGNVYAVDIQDEMLAAISTKMKALNISSIVPVKGSSKSINLLKNSIDKVLMVDVYHEFDFPIEMIASVKKALKPNGKIFLIEYRAEDQNVPIKKVHKMTEKQAVKEFEAAGFLLEENISNLPWQHCMVFLKR